MYGFGKKCENCQDERPMTGQLLCELCAENEIEDRRYEGAL